MKTTFELSSGILFAAKELAKQRNTTLRWIVEDALRRAIEDARENHRTIPPLRDVCYGEGGMDPQVAHGSWELRRSLIYGERE